MKKELGLLMFAVPLFLFTPQSALAGQTCAGVALGHYQAPFSAVIENYEQSEYVDGLLWVHYRLLVDTGTSLSYLVRPFDDTCHGFGTIPDSGFGTPSSSFIDIPAGTKNFSMRFSSPTHYDLWDDDTNTKLECANCSRDLPEFPEHFSIVSNLFHTGVFNGLNTLAYSIREPQPEPPIHTGGLTQPETCPAFETHGGDEFDSYPFFDDYWFAEYKDGALEYHFRFNNGVPLPTVWPQWRLSFGVYDEDCNHLGDVEPFGEDVRIEPYSRYWSIRFTSPTHFEIWNDDLGRKENCAYCSGDIDLSSFGVSNPQVQIKGNISTTIYPGRNYSFASVPFQIEEPGPETFDPVIIIPGILGSAQKNGEWVIDPILHTYDNLIETLKANGYIEGVNLFTFPYDWRSSNVFTAVFLRDKIREVKEICDCNKVDLVAHSMGGLVARQYIQNSLYENDVDQLIFLGTPHLGAPKAYLMWEAGESDLNLVDQLIQTRLSLEAKVKGYDGLFTFIKQFPINSLQQLLPVYDYLRDAETGEISSYPYKYPVNEFLETIDNLLEKPIPINIRIANIIGDNQGNDSIGIIRVELSGELPKWEHGKPEGFGSLLGDSGLERMAGDRTVPLLSSQYIFSSSTVLISDHNQLPTIAESLVYKMLANEEVKVLVTGLDRLDTAILYIQLLSPVDVVVTSPNGKRIGKNFETGEEFNEIPGAFYSGYQTDDEYITIPDPLDGEYKIETQGTGEGGEYTIVTSYIDEATSTEAQFTGHIAPNQITSVEANIDSVHPENISITPSDTVPPLISVISPEFRDYLHSEILLIDIEVSDSGSGVFSSKLSLNGGAIEDGATVDLFFKKLGDQLLSATATDFMGNVAATVVEFRIIATPDSTISDINRAFDLGWITKENTRDKFIRKLEAAIRIEKRIEDLEERFPDGSKLTKKVEKLEKKIDKKLGKDLLKDLDKERGKSVNEQAYQLLLEDIRWMLDN